MANPLRDAILDAIDARDDTVKSVAEAAVTHAVRARSVVVVAAAHPTATEQSVQTALSGQEWQRRTLEAVVHAAMRAEAHSVEHTGRVRAAGPGPDEGPVRRLHLEARRAARSAVGK